MSQVVGQHTVGAGVGSAAHRPIAARVAAIANWSFAREIALMAALFLGYRQIRFLTRNDTDAALANAQRVLDVQRGWFVSERTVQ